MSGEIMSMSRDIKLKETIGEKKSALNKIGLKFSRGKI